MSLAAYSQASAGYAADRKDPFATRSSKSVEIDVIAGVTFRLTDAARTRKSDFPKLAGALHENRRLWTALAADVMDDDNGLPDMLRARIVYLAEFVQLHSAQVLSGTARVRPLVDINLAVLRGLRQSGART